ncbi:MAG: hypothetical protein PHI29_13060 [Gallionella sp.]|nr:hypothetical protein [Gallionella sp.]
MKRVALAVLVIYAVGGLAGCGGGSSGNTPVNTSAPLTASQVAALTPAQISTFTDAQIVALGTNIQYLSNAALGVLTFTTGVNANNSVGQIESITAAQITMLTPAQVRFIGSTGVGGATFTSQITYLNAGAWAALSNDPIQVAAITPAEIATLTINASEKITALGLNINKLSNASLGALTISTWGAGSGGQVQAISAAQIATLTPAQVRFIGSTGVGGATFTSQISYLNAGAWQQLLADPLQVAAITPAEIATLNINTTQLLAFGVNIQYLSNAAIASLSYTSAGAYIPQIQTLSAVEVAALTPSQITSLAGINVITFGINYPSAALSMLNAGAFSSLTAAQIAVLTPANVVLVTPVQLSSLSLTAIAGFNLATKASLTPAQVASLSLAQHIACGC